MSSTASAQPTPAKARTPTASTASLGAAQAAWDGEHLVLSTGVIERRWRWTGRGLASTALVRKSGSTLVIRPDPIADWRLPGGLPLTGATLLGVELDQDDDDGFTEPHLRVRAHIRYADAKVDLTWTAWAIPNANGLRSSITIQAREGFTAPFGTSAVTAEHLGLPLDGAKVTAAGYYTQTQQRNDLATPLLREECIPNDSVCEWASLCAVEENGEGVIFVKESHRCVNQPGHDGGAFILGGDGLRSSGWGLLASEINQVPQTGWAHWTIAYDAKRPGARGEALRAFLAKRYPRQAERDAYVMSNTWGSSASSRDSRDAASEDNILREIGIAADIGVDIVQIDDGWQVDPAARTWEPADGHGWHPHPELYPEGWNNVRAKAANLGVRLGLWCAGMPVQLDELQANYRDGGFATFKLDFMVLKDHAIAAAFRDKVRSFIRSTDHRARINFDVTEIEQRVGYFWLRETGNLYLANRKPQIPESTTYRPCTMLRDAWELAHYQRLQDVQITVQNPARVERQRSDAWQHPMDYCLAIALFASPILFQELHYLNPAQRSAIRDLLAVHRQHRDAILNGDVSAIGQRPTNASQAGFLCRCSDDHGYVLAFRERECSDATWTATVPALHGNTWDWEDCISGSRGQWSDTAAAITLPIPQAPGFRLLRYARR